MALYKMFMMMMMVSRKKEKAGEEEEEEDPAFYHGDWRAGAVKLVVAFRPGDGD